MIKTETIQKYLSLFCIYAMVGWVYEVILWAKDYHAYINRGFCLGPWLPVYGVGGILILLLFQKQKWHPLVKMLAISGFAMSVELITTYILDIIGVGFHTLWNYDDNFLNFQGRIAPWPALKFGIIAMIVLGLQPQIEKVLGEKYFKYIMTALSVLMIADIITHLIIGSNYHYNF